MKPSKSGRHVVITFKPGDFQVEHVRLPQDKKPLVTVHRVGAEDACEAAKRVYRLLFPEGDEVVLLRVKERNADGTVETEHFECGSVRQVFAVNIAHWVEADAVGAS